MRTDNSELPRKILSLNTIGFGVAFAAWIMFGPSARVLAEAHGLTEGQAALIKVIPILTGSVMRIPIGVVTDRFGARRTFAGLLTLGGVAILAMTQASTAAGFIVGGLVLGMVGTTFVVGVQSVSSWAPPSRRGLALGIFGAGNVGTAVTTLSMPLLMVALGWQLAFALFGVALLAMSAVYALGVEDAPRSGQRKTLRDLAAPAMTPRAWLYGLYYTASFGVFVAASLQLGDIYIGEHGLTMATAGMLATTFTFTAGLSRIPGGALADRFGARRVLLLSLPMIGLTLLPAALGAPLPAAVGSALLSALAMGAAMSATLKLVPDDFPDNIGAVSGLVGAIGGLGGFYLPLLGRSISKATHNPAFELLPLIGVTVIALAAALATQGRHAPVQAPAPAK